MDAMKSFLALYVTPPSVLETWGRTPEAERRETEARMRDQWIAWLGENAEAISTTQAAGKTTRVTTDGIADAANGVMLYSVVQAASTEAALALFRNHPHLQIPDSSIDVMEVRPMGPA